MLMALELLCVLLDDLGLVQRLHHVASPAQNHSVFYSAQADPLTRLVAMREIDVTLLQGQYVTLV